MSLPHSVSLPNLTTSAAEIFPNFASAGCLGVLGRLRVCSASFSPRSMPESTPDSNYWWMTKTRFFDTFSVPTQAIGPSSALGPKKG
jgi:hypothetical protein